MKDWTITQIIVFLAVAVLTFWAARQCGRGAYLMLEFSQNQAIQTVAYGITYIVMKILIFKHIGIPVILFIEKDIFESNDNEQ